VKINRSNETTKLISHIKSFLFFEKFTFFPNTFYRIFKAFVFSLSLFHAIHPISFIFLSISVIHDSKTFPFSTSIFSYISITIWPMIFSFTMFFIIFPLTCIGLSILILHGCFSFKLIIDKFSLKNTFILHESSGSVSFVVHEFSIVFTFIIVNGLASSISHIVLPLSFILVS
jgi:hypothetical protein